MSGPLTSTARPKHRLRVRTFAAMLNVAWITAALVACGDAEEASGRINLLPFAEANGDAWAWSSACRAGPHGATGCEAAGPTLGPSQLAGNPWNLGGDQATGSVRMSVNSAGGLEVHGDLSSAPPCTDPTCIAPEANTWVRGYPSVLYGIDQCNASTSPPQSPDAGAARCACVPFRPAWSAARRTTPRRHRSPTASPTTCGSIPRIHERRAGLTAHSRSWSGPTTTRSRCSPKA